MGSATVRISEAGRDALRELAARTGESAQAILEKGIEDYRRRLLEETNAAHAALWQYPEAWARLQQERAGWDATLQDGLDAAGEWTDDGDVIRRDAGSGNRG